MFTHLHVHSEYSLLDGACRIEGLVRRVKELGQTAVAVTDHGVMYGAVDFYKAAVKAGVKPLIGCEVYVAPRTRFDKTQGLDSEQGHLVLLCENNGGYHNLCRMLSRAWTEGFYGKPRVDRELLTQYHEGLIALSACLGGEVPRALRRGDTNAVRETATFYRDLFGEGHYYLELQDHGIPEQKELNPAIIQLADELSIPLVCTNDAHYLTRDDAQMQKVLMCIQTATTIDDPTALAFQTDEFYIKSEEEMRALFPALPAAFDNTADIAARCNVTFEFGKTQLLRFDAPGGDSVTFFRSLCEEGLTRRYGALPAAATRERLTYEMAMIERMGYVDYYLIVYDFVHYARTHGIPVGPGRGSGAGSLCAYCMGITAMDPIEYNLIFERFLNPERVSMPDFDIDFCNEKRQMVIDYVIEKYGADHVAQIITFGTMAARAAIRDVARAMGLSYAVADQTAKLVPWELNMTLDRAAEISSDLRARIEGDPQIRALYDMAKKVEGMPRHASTHAAGVVITDKAASEYVPLCVNSDAVATQYTMGILEELGLLKMDFLGLRNLTIIAEAAGLAGVDIDTVPRDDPAVYTMLSAGDSDGVFQLESAGMKRLLTGLGPTNFEDIIAVISLYRPGPMEKIPQYVYNRHHPEEVRYAHPLLKDILDVTYGCIIYQEQVMQIFRTLGGYSLGRADVVRRAMSKKKHDVMKKERAIFIHGGEGVEGCVKRGVPEKVASGLFDEMESFASYAFNKSHACAYALVSYQTAWLKCHHPQPYMAALLTSVLDSGKVVGYIGECERLGIKVLPPSVGGSDMNFTVEGNNIRFGLLAIKNLGRGFIQEILKERQNGPFASFYDFCKRLSGCRECNRRALESLIKCGALDELHGNRREMIENLPHILDELDERQRRDLMGQIGFFDEEADPALKPAEDYPYAERLTMEKEMTGLYLSGHPLKPYAQLYNDSIMRTSELLEDPADGALVNMLGLVTKVRLQTTKQNAQMAYVTLEDLFGGVELIVFPKTLQQYGALLTNGAMVRVRGRVNVREEEEPKILVDTVAQMSGGAAAGMGGAGSNGAAADTTPSAPARRTPPGLYLRVADEAALQKARPVLALFDGFEPVYVRYLNSGEMKRCAKGVAHNKAMNEELVRLLGTENVVYSPARKS